MNVDAFLKLAADAVDLLEHVLVLLHGDAEPHSADPHPDDIRSLLYAIDALGFAIVRYRAHTGSPSLANGEDDLPW